MHNGKRLHLLAGVKFVFVAILVLFLVEPQLFFHHMNPLEEATVPVLIMEDKHGITVMTYNVRHGRGIDGRVDLERIAAVIRESEADIVALQEVDRYWWRSGMEDQIRRLGEKLEMSWVYAPAIAAGWMQYGNAVLSRFPLVEGEMVLLPGWREPRNMMRVLVEIDGVPVELINTHLGVHAGEREMQLPNLLDRLTEVATVAILLGDFNMREDDPLFEGVLEHWRRVEFNAPTLRGGHRVDHIFVRGPMTVVDVAIEIADASDHFPLKARLVLDEHDW